MYADMRSGNEMASLFAAFRQQGTERQLRFDLRSRIGLERRSLRSGRNRRSGPDHRPSGGVPTRYALERPWLRSKRHAADLSAEQLLGWRRMRFASGALPAWLAFQRRGLHPERPTALWTEPALERHD